MPSKGLILMLSLLALVAIAAASLPDLHWLMFKNQYGKIYPNVAEENLRRRVFAENKAAIDEFNQNKAQTSGWTMGLNHLSDLTIDEFQKLNGFRAPGSDALKNTHEAQEYLNRILNNPSPLPNDVDWRRVPGVVTEVKNQRHCASCWAFATTGLLEAQSRKRSNWTGLSEQDLIDCSGSNFGCEGGVMALALEDIKRAGGIEGESAYPYEGVRDKCRFDRKKAVIDIGDTVIMPINDEVAIQKVVARYGPVATALTVTPQFQHYKSGVFTDESCKDSNPNHAVLIIGYGTDARMGDYWLVKNSWSFDWGEDGFARIARGKNMCQIASMGTIAAFY